MPDRDFFNLRGAVQLLESRGELATVSGRIHWDVELGALCREVYRRKGPALLFSNIQDYPAETARCSQLVSGLFASMRRVSLLLGFDDVQPNKRLVEYVLERNDMRIAPRIVESGPVHKHVITGKDIDLLEFPVPRWHFLDAGRYIGTLGCVVTKDPETQQLNVGIYRGMVVDRDRIAVLIISSQSWEIFREKYRARNEPVPMAWVFGWDPIMEFIAGTTFPNGVCEYEVMGAYRGRPVPLVKCKTVDLLVPADAEMVVEGYLSLDPSTFALEGPFGEVTGYASDVPTMRPAMKVTAITHRDDPLFRATAAAGLPNAPSEFGYVIAIQRAAIAWNVLRNAGIPGILNVCVQPISNGTTVIVQIKKTYEGQPKQIAAALWGSLTCKSVYKIVIVVDDDIDPTSYDAVDWAINYRVDPGSDDLYVFRSTIGWALDPSAPLENRQPSELGIALGNRLLIDATKTWRFPRRPEWNNEKFPPVSVNRPEDIERMKRRWEEYRIKNWDEQF